MHRGSISRHRTRSGHIVWHVRLTIEGKRTSLGLYGRRAEAKAVLAAAIARLGKEKLEGLTLRSWGQLWLDRREADGLHRGIREQRGVWRRYVEAAKFIDVPLRRIQRVKIVAWVKRLLREGGEDKSKLGRQTVINAFNLLHRALGDAADEGKLPVNPATGIKVPKVPRMDETWAWLTPKEIKLLLDSKLQPEQRAAFTIAIYTGLRAGEIWGLRWADVHLEGERPELVVRHSYSGPTKSGKVRRVPLLLEAREALKVWRRKRPGVGASLVFPSRRKGKREFHGHVVGHTAGLASALRAAGIKRRVRFHDLRHSCASHLVQGTWLEDAMSLQDAALWLGHASVQTTERYAHLAPERLHGLVEARARNEKEGKAK